jgi:hypothetical protein
MATGRSPQQGDLKVNAFGELGNDDQREDGLEEEERRTRDEALLIGIEHYQELRVTVLWQTPQEVPVVAEQPENRVDEGTVGGLHMSHPRIRHRLESDDDGLKEYGGPAIHFSRGEVDAAGERQGAVGSVGDKALVKDDPEGRLVTDVFGTTCQRHNGVSTRYHSPGL